MAWADGVRLLVYGGEGGGGRAGGLLYIPSEGLGLYLRKLVVCLSAVVAISSNYYGGSMSLDPVNIENLPYAHHVCVVGHTFFTPLAPMGLNFGGDLKP